MKLLTAITFVACVALAIGTGLTEEDLKKIQETNTACIEKTGIAEEVVGKTDKGEFEDDDKLPEFFLCFFKKPGFINDDGEFQIDTITNKLTEIYGEGIAHSVVADCTKENHGNGPENALHFAKCASPLLKDKP